MSAYSFRHNMESIHERILSHNQEVYTWRGGRDNYRVYFPRVLNLVAYTVEGFQERAHTPGRIMEHFMY